MGTRGGKFWFCGERDRCSENNHVNGHGDDAPKKGAWLRRNQKATINAEVPSPNTRKEEWLP